MKNFHKYLVTLGAIVLAVTGLIGYLIWSGYQEAIHAAEITTRNYAAIIEAQLDATLRRADALLREQVRTLPVAALNQQAVPRYAREINAMLDSHLVTFPELAGLRIYDASGDRLYTSDSDTTPRTYISDRSYFRQLRDNPQVDLVFSEVIISRTTGRQRMPVAKSLRDGQGAFRGIVFATIELDHFQKLFQSLKIGSRGTISLRRTDNQALVLRWPYLADEVNKPLSPQSPTVLWMTSGDRVKTQHRSAQTDGIARIYSSHALERYPFYVNVAFARDDALAAWRARSLVVGLCGLLLMGLLTALLHRLWGAENSLKANEELMRITFEQAAVGIAHVAPDTLRILLANDQYCNMLGYTRSELIGMDSRLLVARDELPTREAEREQIMAGAIHTSSSERRMAKKDGSLLWVSRSLSLVRDADGKPRYFISIIEDISGRRQAEEAYARFAAVAEGSSDAIFIRDLDGKITFWNNGATLLYGYTADEMIGTGGDIAVPPDLLPERTKKWEDVLQGKTVANYETTRVRKNGTRVDVSISMSPVKDRDGKIIGVARISRDITRRKRMMESLQQSQTALKEAQRIARMGSWRLDVTTHQVVWSEECYRMFGWNPQLLPPDCTEYQKLFTPESRTRLSAALARTLETGMPYELELEMVKADGTHEWMLALGETLRDASNAVVGLQGVTMDITERKRVDAALILSEQRYREIIATLPGVVYEYRVDAAGRRSMPFISDGIIELTGLSPIAVMADVEVAFRQIPADALPAMRRSMRMSLRSFSPWLHEFPIRTLSGKDKWLSGHSIPRQEADGSICWRGVFVDISEHKQAEETRAKLAAIVDHANEAIIGRTLDGTITSWNTSAERMFGYTATEAIGRSISMLRAPGPLQFRSLADNNEKLQRGEFLPPIEIQLITKDGRIISVVSSISPIRNKTDKVVSAAVILQDISELKLTRHELEQLNRELEQRVRQRTNELAATNSELEAFSYSVAHDLRAPLRAIDGFSAMVLRANADKLDQTSIEHLKRVRAGSERMGELINDLLNLTQLSRRPMRRQVFNLSKLAATVVTLITETHPERSVQVTIQPDMNASGDPSLMRIALENLIGNAWKFTSKTSEAKIEIGTAQRDGQTDYYVRDNGAGFNMTYAHKLFSPFQRLHRSDDFEGTGIGLATVKKIIQRHDGEIRIESAVNLGTTVFFSLGKTV